MSFVDRFTAAVISAALLTAFHTLASAEEIIAEPVIVTATRTAQTADETLASVQVITRDRIEQAQARDVAELLRFQAGLDIARNGGPGQTTSLFMRGTDSNQTLVLVDGVKMNPGTIGGAAWQNINPAIVDRIEIVRGPRSTLYGSDAIGGVVQIFTRRSKAPLSRSGTIGLGSDNSFSANSNIMGSKGRYRGGLDIALEATDGFPPRTDSNAPGKFSNYSFNLHAGADLEQVDIDFTSWWSQGNADYADFSGSPLDQDFQNGVTALTFDTALLDSLTSSLKLSYVIDNITQTQSDDIARTKRWVADWQSNYQLGEHQLFTGGLYLAKEKDYSISFGDVFDENRNVKAAFLQNDIQYHKQKLLLSARYTDDEFSKDKTTWNVAYGYRVLPKTRVFASAATAFRSPDSTDLFGFGGNRDLRPEESRNIEAGLKHQFNRAHGIQITAFHNKIDDLIIFTDPDGFLGPIPGQNENIDKAKIRGIEAQYRFNQGPWSGFVEGILQDPENRDTGDQLPRRAKKTLTASLNYTIGTWTVSGNVITTGERPNSDFDDIDLDSYTLVDMSVGKQITRSLSAHLRIENLLDENYTLSEGFDTQDRAYFVTLRFNEPVDNNL